MSKEDLLKFLKSQGYYHIREVPGRGLCGVMPFIFTVGLVEGLTETGYKGRWCYPRSKTVEAVVAIKVWDGEKDPIGGWIKYKGWPEEYSNQKLVDNG